MPYSLHQQVKFNMMLSHHELLIAQKQSTEPIYIRTKDIEPFFMKPHKNLDAKEQQMIANFLTHYKNTSPSEKNIAKRIQAICKEYRLPIKHVNIASSSKGKPKMIITCGPMATGKTYTGKNLAAILGCTYIESDVFHRQSSVDKMKISQPLTDEERRAYIQTLFNVLTIFSTSQRSIIVAFPAHSLAIRDELRNTFPSIQFIRFSATAEEMRERCAKRNHPYIPKQCEDLIATQLAINTPLTASEKQNGDIEVPQKPAMKPGQLFHWLLKQLQ